MQMTIILPYNNLTTGANSWGKIIGRRIGSSTREKQLMVAPSFLLLISIRVQSIRITRVRKKKRRKRKNITT